MNTTPLKDDTAAIANVSALREALKTCDGSLGPIRTALANCKQDFRNGFRPFEASNAIALGHIVDVPTPLNRGIGNTFRANLSSMKGYNVGTEVQYSRFAIEAMKAVQARLNLRSCFGIVLNQQYKDAIGEEQARLDKLAELAAV